YTNTYFYKFLEQPYEKVVGNFIFNFIAEDSKEKFEELFSAALIGSSKGEINLDINHQIKPVYVSLSTLQPQLATVGMIITDLTEKKINEKIINGFQDEMQEKNLLLQNKNEQLENQNAELASFSYIASHDLQEPLRKIQFFSNRILDQENGKLSEAGRDYFARITDAAERMQTLIAALLSYSRTNTEDLILVKTDLNKVLSDVKRDLNLVLSERNVRIDADEMPTVKIIPVQFHQLFSNIITNAVKYSKPNVTPHIQIRTEKVPASSIKSDLPLGRPLYWKISVKDNGIGFEPQYESKIFELFQRLHGKLEYEGTGIGLAICKKIMHNHNGFINAIGEPGIGATFNIYLPAYD
ncbi:MAG: ATP-binding protein, partial [Saprospiraceae bacterium]